MRPTLLLSLLWCACDGDKSHSGLDSNTPDDSAVPTDSGAIDTSPSDGGVADGGGTDGGHVDTGPDDTGTPPEDDFDGDGYLESDGDCDDTDATISPLGTEVGATGKDEDCDGYTDLDDIGWEEADPFWQGDRESDPGLDGRYFNLGQDDIVVIPDVDGDGLDELAATVAGGIVVLSVAPGWGVDAPHEAADDARVIMGDDDDGSYWGGVSPFDLATIGDLDGDGIGELAATQSAYGLSPNGVAIYTHASLVGSDSLGGDAAFASVLTENGGTSRETSIAWSDDLDGDGIGDLVIGDPKKGKSWGGVAVVGAAELAVGGALDGWDLADVRVTTTNGTASLLGKRMFILDDLDGDGYATLAGTSWGLAFFVDGDDLGSGDMVLEEVASAYVSTKPTTNLISPGDVDGDGSSDVLTFNDSNSDTFDGVTPYGRVDVFLDLGDGGTFDATAANAHLWNLSSTTEESGVGGTLRLAGPAWLRAAEPDILVSGSDGLAIVPLSMVPIKGSLDLAGWAPAVRKNEVYLGYSDSSEVGPTPDILAADLDHDGDDELVGRGQEDLGKESYHGDDQYPGLIGVLWNPG